MAPDNEELACVVDDPDTRSFSESTAITKLEKSSTTMVQDTSFRLDRLPVELITKILRLACTSSSTLKMCTLVFEPDYTKACTRYCERCLGSEIYPSEKELCTPSCSEIQTYKALTMTCITFHNIINTSNILFKDNTFAFCSLDELNILKSLSPKQRNAIRAISLGFWDYHVSQSQPRAGYDFIASCKGLRSLTFDIGHGYYHASYRDEEMNFIFFPELRSICGLQKFRIKPTNVQHIRPDDPAWYFNEEYFEEDVFFEEILNWSKESLAKNPEVKQKWYFKVSQLEQKIRDIVTRPRLES